MECFTKTKSDASFISRLILVLWVISTGAVCYLSLAPKIEFPIDFTGADLFYHALAYLWLSFLPFFIFQKIRKCLMYALLMILVGIALEFGQTFIPGRDFSILDMVSNSVGSILGMVCGKYVRATVANVLNP